MPKLRIFYVGNLSSTLFAKIKFSRKFQNLQFYGNHFSENNRDSVIDFDFETYMLQRQRGSYMSAHVLLNLLNELRKRDKMRGLPSSLSLFRNEFNKFNNTGTRMLDSIYHMTLRLL